MKSFIHYLPILTTLIAIPFGVILFRHWRKKPSALYLAWWTLGVITYAAGTLTESLTTLYGWDPFVFKAWYISGALLGGVPLAQGTVYLLMQKRFANRSAFIVTSFIVVAAVSVVLSPLNLSLVETHRLSGRVLEWQWVRLFSPFVNVYAVIFLVGGAIWSASKYWRSGIAYRSRMWGNVCIAVGAILPGIGGSFARGGVVEVLYVTELMGLILIWIGYQIIVTDRSSSIHESQREITSSA
jgi:hypothetical protein